MTATEVQLLQDCRDQMGALIVRINAALAAAVPVPAPTPTPTPVPFPRRGAPLLPFAYVDTTFPVQTGKVVRVASFLALQAAVDTLLLGDTIELTASVYAGALRLRNKPLGTGWIVIRGVNYGYLPPEGTRVSPANANYMPKLTIPDSSSLNTDAAAHHFRFVGIEIKPVINTHVYNCVSIGEAETTAAELPHHIIFDRCYVHGDPNIGTRRGFGLNGNHLAVIDSYVSDFKEIGADTQAIWGYNGEGPIKIDNNYLEAAGENIMFGGADPKIAGLIPSDIEITGNTITKPIAWVTKAWSIKNLLELKNARRVAIIGNSFTNVWAAAQNGFAILFTVRNQDNTAPWSTVEDVTFEWNTLANCEQGISILGRDSPNVSGVVSRVSIRRNTLRLTPGKTESRLFQILGGPCDVNIEHNTGVTDGTLCVSDNIPAAVGFRMTNNFFAFRKYSFIGTGTGAGILTFDAFYVPDWVFEFNVLATDNPPPVRVALPDGRLTFPVSNKVVPYTTTISNWLGADGELVGA